MHYHLEVIMPPTDNVERILEQIMTPFSEHEEDEDGNTNSHAFHDYYVIGGRYNGQKIISTLDKTQLDAFNHELIKREVTVSSIQCGKETIKPSSQINMVDQLWQTFFPNCSIKTCPLFDYYKGDNGDIMKLGDIPKNLTAEHVIIAQEHWRNDGTYKAGYMLRKSIYNGVIFQDTKWNGTIQSALKGYTKRLKTSTQEYINKNLPTNDWLCVTVDYHS